MQSCIVDFMYLEWEKGRENKTGNTVVYEFL